KNPISNEKVVFTVLPAQPVSGALPEDARNLELVALDPPCSTLAPVLGDCNGVTTLEEVSSVFGAAVDPILGDTENTAFRVSAAIPGESSVAPAVFTQTSVGDRTFGTGRIQAPRLIMTVRQLINDNGQPLNATRVGTTLAQPLEAVLYVVEDNYL